MTSKSSSSSSETSSSKESASSYSKIKSSSGGRPRSAAEIRQAAYRSLQKTSLTSHAGYSAKPIDAVAKSFQTDPDNVALVLGFIFLVLHLITPTFLLPHLSALVTLIIPLQDTLPSLSYEISRNPGAGRDTCQWLAYWVVYVAFEMARGWVAVWRPGWKGAFEVGRSAGLVTVGGPWFSRDVLKPKDPSRELKEAEQREKAEAAEEAKRRVQKEKKEKEDREKEEKKKEKQGKEKGVQSKKTV